MLQAFENYRDRMLSIMADAETCLRHEPPADSLTLDLARNRMARVLTAYHLFADRELFTPCMAIDTVHRLRLKAVGMECAALANDFRAFTRICIERPVMLRWAEYRLEALAYMARIRKHLSNAEIEARICLVKPAAMIPSPSPIGYRTAA